MFRFLSVFVLCFFSGVSFAKSPVVVEFFGRNDCRGDTDLQRRLYDLFKGHENVILVNCRKWYEAKDKSEADLNFSHKFCIDRNRAYRDRLRERAVIVVNGRWSASLKDIDPAVKLGRLDSVLPVTLQVAPAGEVLDIHLPDLGREVDGQVYVYAYAPSQGEEKIFVDPDVALSDALRARVQAGESVPFVTREEPEQFLFRPLAARGYMGKWNGEDLRLSYSLSEIKAFSGSVFGNDLSYVVVVHDGDEAGEVLAAGEIMSLKERGYFMPKSEPVEVEQVSRPRP